MSFSLAVVISVRAKP